MNKLTSSCILFVLFPLLLIAPMPIGYASNPEPLYSRGPTYETWTDPSGKVVWTSAPQYIFNGSTWVPYIFRDLYASDQKYVVQCGLVGVEIYDYYAMFFDPTLNEIRLYNERWEIQKWTSSGQGKWEDIGAQSGSPIFTITEHPTRIDITKAFHSWAGWLNITYSFRTYLKHTVVWQSEIADNRTFRVVQKWSGIVGGRVNHKNGTTVISAPVTINSTWFLFQKSTGSFSIHENQVSMAPYLQPTTVDVHAQGMKCDFVFANWTLANGETLRIDPDTTTVAPSTDDHKMYLKQGEGKYNPADAVNEAGSSAYLYVADDDGSWWTPFLSNAHYWASQCKRFTFNLTAIGISQGSIQQMKLKWKGGYEIDDCDLRLNDLMVKTDSGWSVYDEMPHYLTQNLKTLTINSNFGSYIDDDNMVQYGTRLRTYTAGEGDLKTHTNWVQLEITYDPTPQIGGFATSKGVVSSEEWFFIRCTVTDGDGIAHLVNATLEMDNDIILKWLNSTNTFSTHYDPNDYCNLAVSECERATLNATSYQLSWRIQLKGTYPTGSVDILADNTKVYDSDGNNNYGSHPALFNFERTAPPEGAKHDAGYTPSAPIERPEDYEYEGPPEYFIPPAHAEPLVDTGFLAMVGLTGGVGVVAYVTQKARKHVPSRANLLKQRTKLTRGRPRTPPKRASPRDYKKKHKK